ncbi:MULTISPECIES: ABC transporter substrate-binding protein [Methylobacterium]|jgi:iron complex transport system substrate-binding protein|uniref:ABC-type Fe3+-hydroxamate transport system, periplasmic component n=1 Tax=Methylobacterium aquaticum TaxID=270351 RepID=A0A0C6G0H0_9HYPH|nr:MULTISPECIES: ABC transporter substrate-binding protein [Methylobacterium]NGM38963.1 ABC transporter substrate-binding protein [Methylobacterium sp. DB0501]BAQ49220.1 ABC-type Fe3+-hydroxamate transport system, periplasmic component [Methylobacterium aquaticum]
MNRMMRAIAAGTLLLTAIIVVASTTARAATVTATDSLGRTVTLERPAQRILLATGRGLPALAILDHAVADRLVGIGRDLQRQSPDIYKSYAARLPRLGTLPVIEAGPGGFPAEQAIALAPDLVILDRAQVGAVGADGANSLLRALAAAGLPVAVIDLHGHPLRDTVPVMRLLGREPEAEAFTGFIEAHLATVAARLRSRDATPAVFLHAHAGATPCCFSPGQGTFNDDILAAGGSNAAAALLPGAAGQVSAEALLGLDPAVYIATGGTHLAGRGGVVLGTGVEREMARATLATVLQGPGLAQLSAIRSGRAYGLWQGFSSSPVNVLAVEVVAKWLHPNLTGDLDPNATLAELNAHFLEVPMDGTYWIGPR